MTDPVELLKSSTLEKVTDLIHKLAGPMAEEIGIMLGDKVRVHRVRNWVDTLRKTDQLIRKAGLAASSVPPRLLLPVMESCSLEDDENLQEMWAGLLASAAVESEVVSPAFIETLKQLKPYEAKRLYHLYEETLPKSWHKPKTVAGVTIPIWLVITADRQANFAVDIFERLGLVRREYNVKNIPEPAAFVEAIPMPLPDPEIVHKFVFTEYGSRFIKACEGPSASSPRP